MELPKPKSNELPKYHETFLYLLEILNKEGAMHYRELARRVRDEYYSHLPADILDKRYATTNENKLIHRIIWGKTYLNIGKLVKIPSRAIVQITEKGKKILDKGEFTIQDLYNDPDYIEYEKNRHSSKKNSSKEDIKVKEKINKTFLPEETIEIGIEAKNEQVKADLLNELKTTNPYYFEKIILTLLNKMGYGDVIGTPKSRDGGIDGIINQDLLGLDKIFVQVKRYNDKSKVRENEIQKFIGAMSGSTKKGIFATTSTFDDKAIEKAKNANLSITLIDGEELVNLMHKYEVGIQVRNTYTVKEIDEDFFDEKIVS